MPPIEIVSQDHHPAVNDFTGLFDAALKQQVVITHDPVNPLHIDRR
jgi:hypothetical protein